MIPVIDERSKRILEFIEPRPKDKILIIGTGVFPKIEWFLFKKFNCKSIISTDIDEKNLINGKKVLPELEFKKIDAERKFPFPERNFDKVIFTEVLEHLKDDVGALNTIHRLLKKGGHLIISVPNKDLRHVINPVKYFEHERHYSNEDIIEKLRGAGFGIEHFNVVESFSLLANLYLHIIMKFLLRKNVPFNFFDRHHNKTYAQYNRHGLDIILKARKI